VVASSTCKIATKWQRFIRQMERNLGKT